MKKRIRLTESDLHRIVKESVSRVMNSANKSDKDLLPALNRTYLILYREYMQWLHSINKPNGMENALDAINNAMRSIKDVINNIEPSDDIPVGEAPMGS